jgi:hypothetical protein
MDNLFNLNNPDFWGIMIRFVTNLLFLFILVRIVYFRYSPKEEFLFSFFLMGIMIFFIGSMLKAVFMEIGMAVGLFAIFTILRLRTNSFTMKDMAYTFTVIGISVINSLKLVGFPMLGLFIINALIIGSAFILEEYTAKYQTETYEVIYEDLETLKSDKKQKLLKDLSARTGKEIIRFRIRNIDYKRGCAIIDIFYKE